MKFKKSCTEASGFKAACIPLIGYPTIMKQSKHFSPQHSSPKYSYFIRQIKINEKIKTLNFREGNIKCNLSFREGNGNPLLEKSCLEESHGRRSLVGCRLWGHTESDTTEAT